MIVGITGHRNIGTRAQRRLVFQSLIGHLLHLKRLCEARSETLTAITGMAIGGDQKLAYACILLGIPYEAYIPFEGQEKPWPEHVKAAYRYLLARASRVVCICVGGFAAWKYHRRDVAIVNNSDVMLTVWRGARSDSNSGTSLTINEALSRGFTFQEGIARKEKFIYRIDPDFLDNDSGICYYTDCLFKCLQEDQIHCKICILLWKEEKPMSASGHILAAGRYKQEIADCLDYHPSMYEKAGPDCRVFSKLFMTVTSDSRRDLCVACKVNADDPNTWQVKIANCDLELLEEIALRTGETGDVDSFKRLAAAGFSFFYFHE